LFQVPLRLLARAVRLPQEKASLPERRGDKAVGAAAIEVLTPVLAPSVSVLGLLSCCSGGRELRLRLLCRLAVASVVDGISGPACRSSSVCPGALTLFPRRPAGQCSFLEVRTPRFRHPSLTAVQGAKCSTDFKLFPEPRQTAGFLRVKASELQLVALNTHSEIIRRPVDLGSWRMMHAIGSRRHGRFRSKFSKSAIR